MSSSWFPFNFSFQQLTPPLSIQRRFISFILKRFLGHLLKPGQLNIDQIDAQIGNGFVEVKNLELDNTAINSLLEGLPVLFQSGRIASVTVRIPWPNPFSSTVGLSLAGMHITLDISTPDNVSGMSHSTDLAESVASVAEEFIHEELSEREEALLRDSIHQGPSFNNATDGLPAFLDPSLTQEPDRQKTAEMDPEGVSIFAGLFERLLARFNCDASNTRITLVHSANAGVTLDIARIRYLTGSAISGESSSSSQAEMPAGETRSVIIEGMKLTMCDLTPSILAPSSPPSPSTWIPTKSLSHSLRGDSDSEMDDETQMMMSQSLVSLPPRLVQVSARPPSPSLSTISSTSSSMYQSAVSASRIPSQSASPSGDATNNSVPVPEKNEEQVILTISEPIVFRLTTPPPYVPSEPSSNVQLCDHTSAENRGKDRAQLEKLKLDISVGIIAICLNARNLRGLLSIASAVSSAINAPSMVLRRKPHTSSSAVGLPLFDRLGLDLHVKGIIALVLGNLKNETMQLEDPSSSTFFSRPLVPPYLPCGYIRLHIDSIEGTVTGRNSSAPLHPFASRRASVSSLSSSSPISNNGIASCTLSDLSVLAFHSSKNVITALKHNASSPILITDFNLIDSYRINQPSSIHQKVLAHSHNHPYTDGDKGAPLPTFDVVDWTLKKGRGHGSSLRAWKTRPAHLPPLHHRKASSGLGAGLVSNIGFTNSMAQSGPSPVNANSLKSIRNPAISIQIFFGGATAGDLEAVVKTAPLHVFVDLGAASSVLNFIDEVLPDYNSVASFPPTEVPSPMLLADRDLPHDVYSRTGDQERERRRLEKLVLDDLNLDIDYRRTGDITPTGGSGPSRRKLHELYQPKPRLDIYSPLVRVEVRVPAPRALHPRSGALVIDIHHSHCISNPSYSARDGRHTPRFKELDNRKTEFEEWFSDVNGAPAASVKMQRVVVAYAGLGQTQAVSALSLGPVKDSNEEGNRDIDDLPPLLPLVLLRTTESAESVRPQAKSTALLAQIPSVHIVMNKGMLDGLQLWADDMNQWAEKLNSHRMSGSSTRAEVSRNPSLIGSRYFIKRAGSESTENESRSTPSPGTTKSELVIKTVLSEGKLFIRLLVPIGTNTMSDNIRHLDICASDIDSLVEVKPEGKEETVVSLNILNTCITEHSSDVLHDLVTSSSPSINMRKQAVLKLRFRSVTLPGTIAKESKVRMTLHGLRINMWSDLDWIQDLLRFAKAPPGAFESVLPSERTQISINIFECAFRITPPSHPSAFVLSLGGVGLSTELANDSKETALNASVTALSLLLTDDTQTLLNQTNFHPETDIEYWMGVGYALFATIEGLELHLKHNGDPVPDTRVGIDGMNLSVYLCADSISGIISFATDLQTLFVSEADAVPPVQVKLPRRPTDVSESQAPNLLLSLDEQAFRRQPVIGPLPDMISDDLPSNAEYLDASFGAAAGFRPLDEGEDDEFYPEATDAATQSAGNIVSAHGGETIKMLCSAFKIIENFYDTLTPSSIDFASEHGDTSVKMRALGCNVYLLLYEGYDWERTRKAIQEEVKLVKRRLAKIRQLLANGQTYDPDVEDVNTVLFNSVYVGLDQDVEGLEREDLMAAIDEELNGNTDAESESSWQSFKPNSRVKSNSPKTTLRTKRLHRSKGPSIEFSLQEMAVDFDQYIPGANLASRLLFTIKNLEILDHIKTSTWSKFLTEMRSDSQGNIRETDSDMVRVELQMLLPYRGHSEQEARLKAKLLPLRLHVDQDALDFLKKFFSFKDTEATPSPPSDNEIFFQHVEIFPIDIKLDYKPRRVDYRALKEGKTIELMNFFHFDGAEMTLRHITLKGITGWPRMFDTLNDLWTPDVKANQLVDVISGVSPIRSAVNVGSGVADLILLPIAQYKKDGRVIRGLQKGTTAFVKSTAMEAIRLGARLATGTQVVLEQTETVLGGQFTGPLTAEAVQVSPAGTDFKDRLLGEEDIDADDLFSKYAEQPTNIKEGMQSAYRTLSQNIKTAGQTILAVPMEVYERSSKEGPARAVIRAVPIAVLKPMIGASEAISKTLLGLHNSLDPQSQMDTEAKYKHR